jgi:hypothetical protein
MRFWNVWGVVAAGAVTVFVNATPTAAQIFQHPGVLVSQAQLDYIKAQYSAKVNPFDHEVRNAQASPWVADLPIAGQPVSCSNSTSNIDCSVADSDTATAYVPAQL